MGTFPAGSTVASAESTSTIAGKLAKVSDNYFQVHYESEKDRAALLYMSIYLISKRVFRLQVGK